MVVIIRTFAFASDRGKGCEQFVCCVGWILNDGGGPAPAPADTEGAGGLSFSILQRREEATVVILVYAEIMS